MKFKEWISGIDVISFNLYFTYTLNFVRCGFTFVLVCISCNGDLGVYMSRTETSQAGSYQDVSGAALHLRITDPTDKPV